MRYSYDNDWIEIREDGVKHSYLFFIRQRPNLGN